MNSHSLILGPATLAATAALALFTAAREGRADPVHGEGVSQFSLEGQLVSYSSAKASINNQDISSTQTSFSLLSGGGVRFGFFLGNEVLLGGRIGLASTSTDTGTGPSSSATAFSVAPLLEYVMSPGESVRPFFGLTVGYSNVHGSTGDSSGTTASAIYMGPSLGMHIFATDTFSIDPSALFTYQTGSLDTAGSDSVSLSGFTLNIGLGISGWFGGQHAKSTEEASNSAPLDGELARPATPPPLRVERGLMTTNFVLTNGNQPMQVVLAGHPRKDPEHVTLRVGRTVGKDTAPPACDGIHLIVDGKITALQHVRTVNGEAGGYAREIVYLGDIDVATLEQVAESRGQVMLQVCGESWEVLPTQLSTVYEFVERFRAKP